MADRAPDGGEPLSWLREFAAEFNRLRVADLALKRAEQAQAAIVTTLRAGGLTWEQIRRATHLASRGAAQARFGRNPAPTAPLYGASLPQLVKATIAVRRKETRIVEAVTHARTFGMPWGVVGAGLGIGRATVHEKYAAAVAARLEKSRAATVLEPVSDDATVAEKLALVRKYAGLCWHGFLASERSQWWRGCVGKAPYGSRSSGPTRPGTVSRPCCGQSGVPTCRF